MVCELIFSMCATFIVQSTLDRFYFTDTLRPGLHQSGGKTNCTIDNWHIKKPDITLMTKWSLNGFIYLFIYLMATNLSLSNTVIHIYYQEPRVPNTSLHRGILLDQRLRLPRVLYGHFSGASSGQRAKRFFLHRLSTATINAFEQVSNVANSYLAYCADLWSYYWPLRTLLSFRDRAPSALTAGPSSS
jgi:hypothetical protein